MPEAIHDPVRAQVTQKLLLRRGKELLILRDADSPNSDLPGGRINTSIIGNLSQTGLLIEFEREVEEELGTDVRYKLNPSPVGTTMHLDNDGVPTFGVYYEGEYVSGEIVLSSEHQGMQWVSIDEYQPGDKDVWKKSCEEFMREYIVRARRS